MILIDKALAERQRSGRPVRVALVGAAACAIEHRKHIILCNVELDATLGPILKAHADRTGVIYSNSDGDEPGVV